jgi:hypothetical protein
MDPTPNLKQIDPLAVLLDVLDAPNVAPSVRTDPAIPDQTTNATHPAPDPHPTAGSGGSTVPPVPPVDTTFRAAVDNAPPLGKRPSVSSRVARGLAGFLLAVCIGIASFVWQSPYGDAARQKITDLTQQFVSLAQQVMPTSSPPAENPAVAAQPNPPADQAAATETTPAQPAPAAQPSPAAQTAPPAQAAPEATAVALSPETTQLLQSMAHDLATVQQGIEQLKASQEQLARDNAKLAEQVKLNQERMVRILAKTAETRAAETRAAETRAAEARVSEQNLRPRPAAYPSRPVAYPTREPVPTLPPPQTIVPPQASTQPQAVDPELSSAPRPPMPVR